MNKYNCTPVRYHADAQELLRITRHKTSWKPSVTHQYITLLTLPDRRMLPIEPDTAYQGYLQSCELWSRLLTVRLTGKFKVRRLHMQVTRSWDCAPDWQCNHEIGTQSWDSESAQCNLENVQIPRVCKTLTIIPNSGQIRPHFTCATYRDRCTFLDSGLVITCNRKSIEA